METERGNQQPAPIHYGPELELLGLYKGQTSPFLWQILKREKNSSRFFIYPPFGQEHTISAIPFRGIMVI